jgi:hypothetical protein
MAASCKAAPDFEKSKPGGLLTFAAAAALLVGQRSLRTHLALLKSSCGF